MGANFIRFSDGQVAGRVVEEHVLAARIRGVDARRVLRGVPAVDGGVVLHAGIAAVPGGVGDLAQQVARLEGLRPGRPSFTARVLKSPSRTHGVHEVVGHAHGVVGVLEEDGRVGLGVRTAAVVAVLDQRPGLGFFLLLALDEVDDVRMVDVEDDHLGGAARLAAGLDDAGEGVEALHEAERAAGGAAAGERSRWRSAAATGCVPVPEPHLNSMPSVLASVRMESSESCTELMKQAEHCGLRVADGAEFDFCCDCGSSASSARRSWARCGRSPR